MTLRISRILTVFIAGLAFAPFAVLAQPAPEAAKAGGEASQASQGEVAKDGDKAAKPEEEVKKGVVASYGKHRQTASVDAASTPASGDEPSAISGSVSRKKDSCIAKIVNNGKNSYSVSFAVIGISPRGNQTFRKTYSASLKPEGSVTREMRCHKDDNVQVEIVSGRKLSK